MGTHALIKDAEGNPMTITKTDTEVLYVDIHIKYTFTTSCGFEWTPWYYYLLGEGASASIWPYMPSLCSPLVAMLRAHPDLMSAGNRIGTAARLTNSYNGTNHVLTCSGGRFGTENQTSQDYINAIGVIPGIIKLAQSADWLLEIPQRGDIPEQKADRHARWYRRWRDAGLYASAQSVGQGYG